MKELLSFFDGKYQLFLSSVKTMPHVDLSDVEDQFELPKLYTWQLPAIVTMKLIFKKIIQFYNFGLKCNSEIWIGCIFLLRQLTTWAASGNIFSGTMFAQIAKK